MEKKIHTIDFNQRNSIYNVKKSIYKVYEEKEKIDEGIKCQRKKKELNKRFIDLETKYKDEVNRLNLINSNLKLDITRLER